jgi:hypothetical protein
MWKTCGQTSRLRNCFIEADNKRQLLSRKVISQATYHKISGQIIATQKEVRTGPPAISPV